MPRLWTALLLLIVVIVAGCSNETQPDSLALADDEPLASSTTAQPPTIIESPSTSVAPTAVDQPTDVLSDAEKEIASWGEGVIARIDTNEPYEPLQQVIVVSGDIQQGEQLSDVLRDRRLVSRAIGVSLVPDDAVLDLTSLERFVAASDLPTDRILVEDMVTEVVEGVSTEAERTQVIVIAALIEQGELLSDVMRTGRLEIREIGAPYVPDAAVLDLSEIEGFVAVSTLTANQILAEGMFVPFPTQ